MLTEIFWLNHKGQFRRHAIIRCTYFYALDWWRRSIMECQGTADMSLDERRCSKLQLLRIRNHIAEPHFACLGYGPI